MQNLRLYLITALLSVIFIGGGDSSYAQVKTLQGNDLAAAEIDNFIKFQMDSLKIPGLSIALVQKGKVVYYRSFGVTNKQNDIVDNNTLFEAASMTKPVFAYAVLKLVNKGVLSLDTPLYKYCPYEDIDYDDRYKLITAKMVLSHTSGFPNWRSGDLTIDTIPGTKYRYSGEGFEYLGKVISRITGKKLQDIIQEEVFDPTGIKNSYLVYNDYLDKHLADGLRNNKDWGKNPPARRPHMAYSLCTEAGEYAKFVIALMKEANSPKSPVKQMFIPQKEYEPQKSVCLGIFTEETPYGAKYLHSGNNYNRYNSNFEFYPGRQTGYAYFMNCHRGNEFTKRFDEFLATGKFNVKNGTGESENPADVGPKNGTLYIVGGGNTQSILESFISTAGGKDAPIVVIPTAEGNETFTTEPFDAEMFRKLGATNVSVLHTTNRDVANSDTFVRPLINAKAVWFSGGRQWRLVDAYKNTLTEKKLWEVLDHGGVIGGTSAGATIQGSYLARGDTKNNQIMMGDHEEGFGFLKNVAIDQHVLARNRQFDMFDILKNRPELLGIGIDEGTAIVVNGNQFKVIGKSYVSVYDGTFWSREGSDLKNLPEKNKLFYFLRKGDKYDLKSRKIISGNE